jgi:hypothetical protein
MSQRSTISGPTKEEMFGEDFSFGHNVPQDSQDSQESHRLSGTTRLSSTLKEKQRVFSPSKEKREAPAPLDPGEYDFAEWVGHVYDSRQEQPEEARGHWRSPLFYFARFVKSHPAVTELSDHEAAL